MTIDEAIKDLEALLINRKSDLLHDTLIALPLGIEALKREREHRKYPEYYGGLMLPGETED